MPEDSYDPAAAPRPGLAERARTLLARARTATLSTSLVLDADGSPFGSLVGCASDAAGNAILALSSLAVHSQNLAADPRASLLVTTPEPFFATSADGHVPSPRADPLASLRVTLVGRARRVAGEERPTLRSLFLERHPEAERWIDFGDFAIWCLAPSRIWAVAGFGEMGWVEPAVFAAATPDPLADAAAGILAHMNADHADALVAYCDALAGVPASAARMTGIDRRGFDMEALLESGPRAVRIAFASDVTTPEEARRALVGLVHVARERAGSARGR